MRLRGDPSLAAPQQSRSCLCEVRPAQQSIGPVITVITAHFLSIEKHEIHDDCPRSMGAIKKVILFNASCIVAIMLAVDDRLAQVMTW